jgi:hypothetical protein
MHVRLRDASLPVRDQRKGARPHVVQDGERFRSGLGARRMSRVQRPTALPLRSKRCRLSLQTWSERICRGSTRRVHSHTSIVAAFPTHDTYVVSYGLYLWSITEPSWTTGREAAGTAVVLGRWRLASTRQQLARDQSLDRVRLGASVPSRSPPISCGAPDGIDRSSMDQSITSLRPCARGECVPDAVMLRRSDIQMESYRRQGR